MITGYCFACGKIVRMLRKKFNYTCIVCHTQHEIHKDRVEIIVKNKEK